MCVNSDEDMLFDCYLHLITPNWYETLYTVYILSIIVRDQL